MAIRSPCKFALLILFALIATTVEAASWRSVRDSAMTLREKGQPVAAYNAVVSAAPSGADIADQQFLAGFIALRSLGRPDLSLQHFKNMLAVLPSIPTRDLSETKAMSGYWMGKALLALKRDDDAKKILVAAAAYRDTFYGQMAASEAGLKDSRDVLSNYRNLYPDMQFFWIDERVRRELVLAVIKVESAFKQSAVSSAGAKGMMQIMDGTALATGRAAGIDIDLKMVAANQHYNIAVGSKIMGDLLSRYGGNVLLAAAAYNAGAARADEWITRFGDPRGQNNPVDWIECIPFRETRNYVKAVVSDYIAYLALASTT